MNHIRDCLQGAGCSRQLCDDAERLEESGHTRELLPALAEHRLRLLDELHQADARLDCLDRAIASIKKSN